jgi:hypothetical protein
MKARPFLIKRFPCNTVLLRANNAYCLEAQKLLGMGQGRIASQLTKSHVSLFIRRGDEIIYLEYEDEPLAKRADRLGRNLANDIVQAYEFKTEMYVKKRGLVYHLKDYKSYSDAGRQLGLTTGSDLTGFCQMAVGTKDSCRGWTRVY